MHAWSRAVPPPRRGAARIVSRDRDVTTLAHMAHSLGVAYRATWMSASRHTITGLPERRRCLFIFQAQRLHATLTFTLSFQNLRVFLHSRIF